jgi:hypothetical protein
LMPSPLELEGSSDIHGLTIAAIIGQRLKTITL